MHISEGILSAEILLTGAALAGAGVTIGLKKLDYDQIPRAAIFSAAFFVASLIHIPIGPANVHLTLNGLLGIFLGWGAFPAILISVFLQAVIFNFGGLTSLGVNCLNMALPSVICFYIFRSGIKSERVFYSVSASFLCGLGSVLLASLLVALFLVLTGESFVIAAKILVLGHLPVMIIEGLITVLCVNFLKKVKPEIME